jgi:23S rRNA (pseudouridine1915-N3)-methyltransferase
MHKPLHKSFKINKKNGTKPLRPFFCYNGFMIRVICGGRKNVGWVLEAVSEYEKRLRKPFDVAWEFVEEEKFLRRLEAWPFSGDELVICCDERGKNISSGEYSEILTGVFVEGRNIVILIGGAYGFSDSVREKVDFVWSFSKLVFPHQLFRCMVVEQIYRASQIASGGKYHHE